jgi:hypothetical protein
LKIQKKLSKRKNPTLQNILHFFFFVGHFCPPGSGFGTGGTADQEPDPADQNQCGSMRFRIQLPICNTGKNYNYSYGTDTIKAEKKNRKNNFDAFTPVVTHPRYINFVTRKNRLPSLHLNMPYVHSKSLKKVRMF